MRQVCVFESVDAWADMSLPIKSAGFNYWPIAELPVIDGSALGWAREVQKAGLQPAATAAATEALACKPDHTWDQV